jgi:hypothetical protein
MVERVGLSGFVTRAVFWGFKEQRAVNDLFIKLF